MLRWNAFFDFFTRNAEVKQLTQLTKESFKTLSMENQRLFENQLATALTATTFDKLPLPRKIKLSEIALRRLGRELAPQLLDEIQDLPDGALSELFEAAAPRTQSLSPIPTFSPRPSSDGRDSTEIHLLLAGLARGQRRVTISPALSTSPTSMLELGHMFTPIAAAGASSPVPAGYSIRDDYEKELQAEVTRPRAQAQPSSFFSPSTQLSRSRGYRSLATPARKPPLSSQV